MKCRDFNYHIFLEANKRKKNIHQQKENKEKFIIFLVVVEQIMTKQVIHQVFEHTGNKHKNIPLEHINVCI